MASKKPMKDPSGYEPISSDDIEIGEIYYVSLKTFPGPFEMSHIAKGLKPGQDPMTPLKIIDMDLVEFLDEGITGHDAGGRVPSFRGWNLDVRNPGLRFYRKVDDIENQVSVKKGELKGKKGQIIKKFAEHTAVVFSENVGGYSLDGKYPKGTCLVIEDDYLHFRKKKKQVKPKKGKSPTNLRHLAEVDYNTYEDLIGTRVVLTTSRHGCGPSNPVWKSLDFGNIIGTIDNVESTQGTPLRVMWDSGVTNVYNVKDLSVIEDTPLVEENTSTVCEPAPPNCPHGFNPGDKVIHRGQADDPNPRIGMAATVGWYTITVVWDDTGDTQIFPPEDLRKCSAPPLRVGDRVRHVAATGIPRPAIIIDIGEDWASIKWEDNGNVSGFPLADLVAFPDESIDEGPEESVPTSNDAQVYAEEMYHSVRPEPPETRWDVQKGTRVILNSRAYGDSDYNPVWGGTQGYVEGTVTSTAEDLRNCGVKWDNGRYNVYLTERLALTPYQQMRPEDQQVQPEEAAEPTLGPGSRVYSTVNDTLRGTLVGFALRPTGAKVALIKWDILSGTGEVPADTIRPERESTEQ